MSLFVSLSAFWMYRYAVYAVLDGVEAGTLYFVPLSKKRFPAQAQIVKTIDDPIHLHFLLWK